ncbi:MAG: hypothetical protein ACR2F2_03995 [Pyrinomonadaceae bacterium]
MTKLFLLFSLILSAFAFSVLAQNENNSGRVFWRGTVDDVVRIKIQGSDLSIETVSGRSYSEGSFSFTSPLPDAEVAVGVNKKEGRGTVEVIQQPNESNDFTAVIEIKDTKGGAKEYQLEIFWQ